VVSAVGHLKNLPPKRKNRQVNTGCAKSGMRGDETPEVIFMKFGTPIDIHDVGTWWGGGQIEAVLSH